MREKRRMIETWRRRVKERQRESDEERERGRMIERGGERGE